MREVGSQGVSSSFSLRHLDLSGVSPKTTLSRLSSRSSRLTGRRAMTIDRLPGMLAGRQWGKLTKTL